MKVAQLNESEADFQRAVIQLAQMTGWRVAHFRPAQNGRGDWRTPVAAEGAGWPDLVLARSDRLLFRELKTITGKLTIEQLAWGEALRTAGADWSVWRPTDWDLIESALKREPTTPAPDES